MLLFVAFIHESAKSKIGFVDFVEIAIRFVLKKVPLLLRRSITVYNLKMFVKISNIFCTTTTEIATL